MFRVLLFVCGLLLFGCEAPELLPIGGPRPKATVPTNLTAGAARGDGETYYVSTNGDDNASGLAPDAAWGSLDRINGTTFGPGDRILLEGGATFRGNLEIVPERFRGTADRPILIGSSDGRPVEIVSDARPAVQIESVSGLTIERLRLIGNAPSCDGSGFDGAHGINLLYERGQRYAAITLSQIDISGYCVGVVARIARPSRLDGLHLTEVRATDNRAAGIVLLGDEPDPDGSLHLVDVRIVGGRAAGSPGVPRAESGAKFSGSGVFIAMAQGVRVERITVADNGGQNSCIDAGVSGGGTSGIAIDGIDIEIRGAEVIGQRVAPDCPWQGGGITVSGRTLVVERNYTHRNDGPGITIDNAESGRRATVQRNVSLNDARRSSSDGGIRLGGGQGDYQIHHNTVFVARGPALVAQGEASAGIPREVSVRNNLFGVGEGPLLLVDPTSIEAPVFHGNHYFDATDRYLIAWGHEGFEGIARFVEGADQERFGGQILAETGNPHLCGTQIVSFADPDISAIAVAVRPGPGSPLRDTGINLASVQGARLAPTDFSGTTVPAGRGPDRGAIEHPGGLDGC
ncbi:MAG: hypothetical protein FJ033_02070 [Chloroflexi bacterium]|nr:hypothetical protein [Chloroflexota bacterium]